MKSKLAINGGTPVRSSPLPPPYPGASLIGSEEIKSVIEVLERKSPYRYYGENLALKVKSFEASVTKKFGTSYALAVTSGTAAIIVALKALGIGPGDKVIVPANTFIATAGAVIIAGAVPVFADIDDSLNIDPLKIEEHIDKYTRAILTVPLLGNPCEMDKINAVAKKHNLYVVEDVAQSMGCKYKGKYSGTIGDIGAFSLQINKVITTGDGGVVVTDNEKHYVRAVRYHDQGMFREKEGFLNTNEKDDIFVGQNYRMSELSGAVAFEQFKKLDSILGAMRKVKYLVREQVKDISGIKLRRINDEEGDTGSKLMMILPDKEKAKLFTDALNAENISTSSLYGGRPVYMMPQIFNQRTVDKNSFPFNQFDEKIVYKEGMCPFTEEILPRCAGISINPVLGEIDAQQIVEGIKKVAAEIL